MTNRWLEIRLTAVPDNAVDVVSQALMTLGCTGMTAAEVPLDTFVVPDPAKLANDPVLKVYFPYPDEIGPLLHSVQKTLSDLAGIYPGVGNTQIAHRELADHDWARDWQQHFPPFRVGRRLVIRPSWFDWPTSADEAVLTLDPGQAFGTGTHATTSLCLNAIADQFEEGPPPGKVLDVGTGSGILAMAGAALGATETVGIDIDPEACRVARENVVKNGLEDQITITDAPLEDLAGRYDLVLANILAAENLRLASALVDRMTPGTGRLILSGILIEQEQQVIDGLAGYPLDLVSVTHRDEWTCIVYQSHE